MTDNFETSTEIFRVGAGRNWSQNIARRHSTPETRGIKCVEGRFEGRFEHVVLIST
jgi:hypothetical protein